MQDGDEVVVLPGTYTETDEIDIVNAIEVHGQDGQPRPTINSSAFSAVKTDKAATIRHLAINHTGTYEALTIYTTTGSATVDDVIAHSNAGSTCELWSATVRDSVCWNSKSANFGAGIVALVNAPPPVTATLRNVTSVATGPMSYGISVNANGGATAAMDAKSVITDGTSYDVYAANVNPGSVASVTLDHSNYASYLAVSGATITDPSTNMNQTGAPAFVDGSSGNFHELSTSSATIDLGATDGSSGTADIDGDPRTLGSAPDIGADEFVPSSPPPPGGGGGGGTPPSNSFTIGSVKGKTVSVDVPGPGDIDVKDANAAKKKLLLKPSSATASGAGTVQVPLKLTKTAKKTLKKKGRVKVSAAITFTPSGGTANSQTAKLKLKK